MNRSSLVVPDALLEREHEVDRVRGAVREVGQRVGAVVVIEGAAGMGKSRLLDVTRVRAAELGLRVLSARATELEQGFPFGVIRQLFERAIVEAEPGERERWLAGAAALAADVLNPRPASDAIGYGPAAGDSGYAWQHGFYWLASNLSADSPLVLLVDDLQWCDAPSARALAFIARRLEGQALGLILATRPLDPRLTPEAAAAAADPTVELLRLSPLTLAAVRALVARRLRQEPDDRFVQACLEVTGGNPFLVGELLAEVAARGVDPTAAAAGDVGVIVPRGVANAVLLRLARLAPPAATLARVLSVLGDGAQVGDAAQLAGLQGVELEEAMASLRSSDVVEPGGTVRFTHPILRAAIYGDLSAAERERLHRDAARILREREAPAGQIAAHVMHTEPAADPGTVTLLRDAARGALALGDAAAAAALLSRALQEPPTDRDRSRAVLELGQAYARAGAPEASEPLSEIVERGQDPAAIAEAAIELSGMFFYGGRAAEGVAILRRAQARLPASGPAHDRLEVALLGGSYSSVSARRGVDAEIANLRDPGGPARGSLQATTLATLALDEVMYLRSASTAIDLAQRALAMGLPLEPHRGENWVLAALYALMFSDHLEAAESEADEILARGRERGAAVTVVAISAFRAFNGLRRGALAAAATDAQLVMELAPELLGAEFLVTAVSTAVLAGLERDETPDALRRLIDRTGFRFDPEFTPSAQLLYASGVLRAAAGTTRPQSRCCAAARSTTLRWAEKTPPSPLGGRRRPFLSPISAVTRRLALWPPTRCAAPSLSVRRARLASLYARTRSSALPLTVRTDRGGARRVGCVPRAAGVCARVGRPRRNAPRCRTAHGGPRAPARGARARRPLWRHGTGAPSEGGARRDWRPAAGHRPLGSDSLTPSERRVVDLAATGGTNREIAQMLFVTEKTVETHLGRAFRKLDISSRRQLPDVLAHATS